MALRSFSEIGIGQKYPPDRERTRVAYQDRWLQRYSRQFADNTQRLKPNTFRFVAQFYSDQVVNTAPTFVYDGDARQQELVELIAPSVVEATRAVVIDLVRYGCGVFANKTPWEVTQVDPRYYYPVCRPEADEYLGAVTVLPYIVDPQQNLADHIAITEYRAGSENATTRFHRLDNMIIGQQSAAAVEQAAAHPILVTFGNGAYGTSWYEDIDEYVTDLHRRESSVSVALDRHTNPHLAVHEGSLSVSATGNYVIEQDGMVLPIPAGADVAPQYVVWDAKFDAQQDAMERAIERIQRFSFIAPVLTQSRDLQYNLPSGSALRRLSIITVGRIQALREILTPAMRRAVVGNADVIRRGAGIDAPLLEPDRLDIQWPLPLHVPEDPNDPETTTTEETSNGD